MAKPSTVFVCSNCGNESSKWFGRCPACNEWNTCYEEKINLKSSGKSASKKTATENQIRQQWHEKRQSSKNYLIDNISDEMAQYMKEKRLGKQ